MRDDNGLAGSCEVVVGSSEKESVAKTLVGTSV